ncbi:hypothetical protein F4782DRAFT_337702 [Xylaria castorea]|nr:hypothetical protein F4782DRAFT_337702 [Xylaria castorea]
MGGGPRDLSGALTLRAHLNRRAPETATFRRRRFGCNNPILHVLSETTREFNGNKEVGCILSLGSGVHSAAGFQAPKGYQRVIPKDLVHAITRMVTDCREVADQMIEQFKNYRRLYHRFNVGYELGAIGLNEWSRLGEVEAHTRA